MPQLPRVGSGGSNVVQQPQKWLDAGAAEMGQRRSLSS